MRLLFGISLFALTCSLHAAKGDEITASFEPFRNSDSSARPMFANLLPDDPTRAGGQTQSTTEAPQPGDCFRPGAASGPTLLQRALCEECPSWGLVTFVGYDAWRGVTDDSWENNGIHAGANFGTRLGPLSDATGIGFQVGGSVGVYDWSGTDYRPIHQNSPETQAFITYGFFRKSNENSGWNAAIVQDWMLNNNFGVLAQNPSLSQLRAQLGYAFSESNELGLWGTCRVLSDTRMVGGLGPDTFRAIDQVNLYWHHKWKWGGDTVLWIGLPEQDRLNGSGSLGEYIAGASANVPLNDRLALYTLVTYMHPSAGAGPAGSEEEAWNFTIGVSMAFGSGARSSTVAGQRWTPQLPVANNGYFFVDTSR